MATFTMEEFIAKHDLKVDLGNPQATRMIAKKLKDSGYRVVRRVVGDKRINVYTNDADLTELKSKLADITL